MTGNDASRGTASLAQRSQRGSLLVTFIGGALLDASVFWTGMELLPSEDGMKMPARGDGGHEMSAETLINVDDWTAVPTLDTAVYPDPVGGGT